MGTVAAIPREAVAALFIQRQQLDRPRGRRLSAATLAALVEDTGGLQLDSINVLARAHYLTAWSRFGPYAPDALDELVWGRRVLVEYWAHAACLVAARHLPAWRRAMHDYAVGHSGWAAWLRKEARVLRAVEAAVRARGPLGNAEMSPARRRRAGAAGGWWNWRPAQHAIHYLWMRGVVLVHSRVNFQKRYDLAERVLGAAPGGGMLSREEFLRWHLRQSLHAMGAATIADLRGYLTFPRWGPEERRRVLAAAVADGEVVEVRVVGGRSGGRAKGGTDRVSAYALAEDLPALETAVSATTPAPTGTTLLSPFDSFLWHRERTRWLFGFDYRIEVYTPGARRVHGYYTLPIYHDGQLIGRVDAKLHRSDAWLEVRHVQLEDWFTGGRLPPAARWGRVERGRALAGLGQSVRSLAEFLGATRVTVARATPARVRAEVVAAIG